MRISKLLAVALIALVTACATPFAATACSTFGGYVRPSNFELVQIADAIVIAQPMAERAVNRGVIPTPDKATIEDAMGEHWTEPVVRVRLLETLKGAAAGEIEVEGLQIGSTWPSDSGQITYSHPEGHMGPCTRTTLAKGKPYLLFLTVRDGKYFIMGFPFSRVSEDYVGERSLWSRAVRTYLAVQRTNAPMAQIEELESLRDDLTKKMWRTRFEQALVRDIDNHLGSISQWKPTPFLLRAYDDHTAGRPPRYPDRDPSFDAEGGVFRPTPLIYAVAVTVLALTVFVLILVVRVAIVVARRLSKRAARFWTRRFVVSSVASALAIGGLAVAGLHLTREIMIERMEREYSGPPLSEAQKKYVKRARILYALLEGEHPDALPIFERLAGPDANAQDLAMSIRFLAKNGRYLQAFDLIENRALAVLTSASKEGFLTLAYAISEAQEDPYRGEGTARWRSDPNIEKRWPSLAIQIVNLGDEREFYEAPDFEETLSRGLASDYRATPEVTFAMSGRSIEIAQWANQELANPEHLRSGEGAAGGTSADPLHLPLKIAMRWYSLGDDAVHANLEKIFCFSRGRRQTLFRMWGEYGNDDSDSTMMRLAASPSNDEADRRVLAQSTNAWAKRNPLDNGKSPFTANDTLEKMAQGRPIGAQDIGVLAATKCPAAEVR